MAAPRPDSALTVLTPVADDPDSRSRHLESLAAELEALQARAVSPFSLCETVHMARFVLVEELPLQLGDSRREFLARNYLLFIAELTGHRDDFLDELYDRSEGTVRAIWGHCTGFPHARLRGRHGRFGAVHFRRYMQRYEIETLIPFVAFQGMTARHIRDALETRMKVVSFIERHPPWATSDALLYEDWRAEFGDRRVAQGADTPPGTGAP